MTLLDLITRSNFIILLTGMLLIVGVLGARFSSKMGMPSLVFYIGVGLILGEFFYYDNAFVTQLFGIFALIVILFEGGLQTHWEVVRPVMRPALSLATVGVVVTAGVIGAFALNGFWMFPGWKDCCLAPSSDQPMLRLYLPPWETRMSVNGFPPLWKPSRG